MMLEWEQHGHLDSEKPDWFDAETPFGFYTIEHGPRYEGHEMQGWFWTYCFQDVHDDGEFACESVIDGKNKAERHWQERIAPIVGPYKDVLREITEASMSDEINTLTALRARIAGATVKKEALVID